MSLALQKRVFGIIKEGTKPYRKNLDNSNLHVLELSFQALKASVPTITIEDYTHFIDTLKAEYPVEHSLKLAVETVRDHRTLADYAVLVIDRKFGTYLIGYKYKNIQNRLAKILKKSTVLEEFRSVNKAGQITANIGHIAGDTLSATQSPLSHQLLDLAFSVPQGKYSAYIYSLFEELNKAHDVFDVEYEFTRPDFDTAKFNEILGGFSVLVTLQSFKRNNTLATETEKIIATELRNLLKDESFRDLLIKEPGSNTIVEDIELLIKARLTGKREVSKHKPHGSKTPAKAPKSASKVVLDKIPKLRNIQTGRLISLTSLQTLLDRHLQDVTSANMGNEGYPGGQRKTLNYRTGRFAASVKVERLSQSREGMVTAFYKYMRNPYQTFEPGFKQGNPKTRDPKLLIAGSIREIAATIVGNKLRAVSI